MTGNRIGAIDFLRGLAIVGMVLSGQMLWNAALPAALFHAQLPPPTFAFDPSVPGITWVDLVFPFFLFSLGAALPFALRRREQQGVGTFGMLRSALHRWLFLTVFAIALGNTRMGMLNGVRPLLAAVATLVVWGVFFVLFVRIPGMERRRNARLNGIGLIVLCVVIALYRPIFGVEVSLRHSDIIILILGYMALFGSLAWWFTRNNVLLRYGLIAALALLKLASAVEGSWCEWLWQQTPAEWLFRFEFLKYLCIVLPGTVIGDLIYTYRSDFAATCDTADNRRERVVTALFIATLMALVGFVLWGLFVRNVGVTVVGCGVLCACAALLLQKMHGMGNELYKRMLLVAIGCLAIGLIAEPLEGGIKKDPATVSYFFVTSALAASVVLAALVAQARFGAKFRLMEACGANPMFAYTASGYLIAPLTVLIGLAGVIERLAASSPGCGFFRGVFYAAVVMAVTFLFTRKNYYWKS